MHTRLHGFIHQNKNGRGDVIVNRFALFFKIVRAISEIHVSNTRYTKKCSVYCLYWNITLLIEKKVIERSNVNLRLCEGRFRPTFQRRNTSYGLKVVDRRMDGRTVDGWAGAPSHDNRLSGKI